MIYIDYYNTGVKIKTLRKQKGFTQEHLAELADINVTYLGRVEREESSPTIDMIDKIARALNISLIDLLYVESQNISEIIKDKKIVQATIEYINTVKKILNE